MNYISEINGFYHWLVENPIPANGQALWHRLMAYANQFNWRSAFSITNTRLIEDLGITKAAFERARNILAQNNLIRYEKGNGSQCGKYAMVSFVSQNSSKNRAQSGHKPSTMYCTVDAQCVALPMPLDKLNETKLNETKKDTNVSTKNAKIPKKVSEKIQFAEFVAMTEEEHTNLLEKYSNVDTARLIEILNNYKGSSGKQYKSDYLTILNWVVARLFEEKAKCANGAKPSSNPFLDIVEEMENDIF